MKQHAQRRCWWSLFSPALLLRALISEEVDVVDQTAVRCVGGSPDLLAISHPKQEIGVLLAHNPVCFSLCCSCFMIIFFLCSTARTTSAACPNPWSWIPKTPSLSKLLLDVAGDPRQSVQGGFATSPPNLICYLSQTEALASHTCVNLPQLLRPKWVSAVLAKSPLRAAVPRQRGGQNKTMSPLKTQGFARLWQVFLAFSCTPSLSSFNVFTACRIFRETLWGGRGRLCSG